MRPCVPGVSKSHGPVSKTHDPHFHAQKSSRNTRGLARSNFVTAGIAVQLSRTNGFTTKHTGNPCWANGATLCKTKGRVLTISIKRVSGSVDSLPLSLALSLSLLSRAQRRRRNCAKNGTQTDARQSYRTNPPAALSQSYRTTPPAGRRHAAPRGDKCGS